MEKIQTFGLLCLQELSKSSWNGGTTCIIGEIKAKDNLNIANFMQTYENLLLQNFLTECLDIAQKQSLVIYD